MASQDGAQEVVVLFDTAGSKIGLEMHFGQFKALLGQQATLVSHAAATVKAAYTQVGPGLAVQAVVFFLFKVNEQGYVDPAFNLPLDYMAQNAGRGPDLGRGATKMACRSQCPVPWHAINMWEPEGDGKAHPAMLVQKTVLRNRLQLKPLPVRRSAAAVGEAAGRIVHQTVVAEPRELPKAQPADLSARLEEIARGSAGVRRVQAMDRKLTQTFGQVGRVSVSQYTRQHREQMGEVADRFRDEMHRQQQGYLEQIRGCREEIQHLKAALRHEKERNRRLQQLLRGDF